MALNLDIVDAHHHVCDLTHSYPWLEGPVEPFRYHGDDRPIRRSYLIDDYLRDFDGLRLVGSIHIENGAADPLWETMWVDTVRSSRGLPSALVAKVDLLASDARAKLAQQASFEAVHGVRDILNWHPDPTFTHRDRNDLMTDAHWLDGFCALAEYGLSFDLQVYPQQLPDAAKLAADHPDIRIILDHAGMPIGRDPDSVGEWRKGMTELARRPNVVTKISGLGLNDHAWTIASVRPFVLETINIFGPQRCMFGSNFPVDGLYSSLVKLYVAFDELTLDLNESDRRSLFAETARRTYRLGKASA